MKTSQKQATARLFKKLSALRATLSNEEREILDNLMGVNDVNAHKMTSRAAGKAASRTASRAAGRASEVAAHKMTSRAAGKAASRAASRAAGKSTFRIVFDPITEEYKIEA